MATRPATRVRATHEFVAVDVHWPLTCAPEIDGCGFRVWTPRSPQRMGLHDHRHWEFCLLISGAMDWRIEDEFHAIRSNELFVIAPGARHDGCDRIRYRSAIAWLCLAAPLDELPGIERAHARLLADGFAALRHRRFAADPEAVAAFAGALAATRREDDVAPLAARAALHRLLAAILACGRAHEAGAATRKPDARVRLAAAILRERVASPMRVDDLARAVGLSRTVLHERFVAEHGLSPMAWWTRLRVDRAKELLRAGATNAAVAASLRFASAQHFATVFRKATGRTPRAWLAARARDGREDGDLA